MDRKRLAQVQTTELTESRVNDDFLFWLKNSGPNWLLAALLVACAYLGWNWWQQRAEAARAKIWDQLAAATTPQELLELAANNPDESGLAVLAQINAGDIYLQSIVTGVRFDRDAAAADAALDEATRKEWAATARAAYLAAAEQAQRDPGTASLAIPALFGVAALDEEAGDFASAKATLERIATLAATNYDTAAALASTRLGSLDGLATPYPVAPAPPPPAAPAELKASSLPALPTNDELFNTIAGSGSSAETPAAPAPDAPSGPAPDAKPE